MPKASKDRAEIERFLRGCFSRGENERIELRQITATGALQRVFDWNIEEQPEEARSPEAFAEEIEEYALGDVQSMRGPTRYTILMFRKDESEPWTRKPFMKRGDAADNGTWGETEEPNEHGLTSMAMRHSEANARMTAGANATLFSHYDRIINRQDNQLEKAYEQMVHVFELAEKLSSGVEERRLAARKHESQLAMQEGMLDQARTLIPVIAAKFLGPGAAPSNAKDAVIVDGLRTIMRTMRPDQLEALVDVFKGNPAQQAGIVQLYSTLAEEEEAKEAERAKRVEDVK